MSKQKGFTLLEVLVAVAIISILSAIVMSSISGAREASRDKKRLADIKQVELALELYREANGYYPRESDGYSGSGSPGRICPTCAGPINDVMRTYLGGVPEDPKGEGDTNSTYYYYYDGQHTCQGAGVTQSVLIIKNMEDTNLSNMEETICFEGDSGALNGDYGTEGRTNNNLNAYYIVLGQSS